METEHFVIIYEQQDRQSAQEVYTFCEEVYDNVTKLLDSYPKKIKVLLHGRIDMANGSYYPIPEHLNLYITSPTDYFNGALTENWLKSLLTHELTHYVHISYEKGWLYGLSKVFGSSIKTVPGAFLPGWLLEGITTNTETMFTKGGRGRNPLFEVVYKTHILEGNLFTLKQAGYSSDFPPHGRIYIAGYIFVNYLLRQYGEDILKEIHLEMIKMPLLPDRAILRVTGKTTDQLWDEMRLELMDKYAEDKKIKEGTRISPYEIGDWQLPRVSDKGLLLFHKNMKESPGLFWFDTITKEKTRVSKGYISDRWSYSCNKSGSKIVFATYDIDAAHPSGATYTSDLFMLSNDKKRAKRITKDKHLWHPTLCASGDRLIAVQKRASYSDLVEVFAETGETKTLFSYEQSTVFNPTLSPDGSKILFILNIRGKQDLWILDDKGARPLTAFNGGSEYYPIFNSDEEAHFTSDKSGSMALYSLNLLTQEITKVLTDPVGVVSGLKYKQNYIYSTYRSQGYSLFLSELKESAISLSDDELRDIDSTALFSDQNEYLANVGRNSLFNIDNYPPALELEDGEEKFYPNIPYLIGWVPIPFNYMEKSTAESPFGIGAGFFAQSIDKKTFVQALVSFPFTKFQPSIFLDVSFPIWRVNVSYSLKQQYGSFGRATGGDIEKVYFQSTSQQLNLGIPFYYHQISGETFSVNANTGFFQSLEYENSEAFHLFDAPQNNLDALDDTTHTFDYYGGLNLFYAQTKSYAAIYPALQVSLSGGVQVGLPYLSRSETNLIGSCDFGLSIPVAPLHNIFTSFNIAYANDDNVIFNFNPRGFSGSSIYSRGKGLATLGYNFNIATFDLPLISSFSLKGLAAAVFVQTQFWFDVETDFKQMDNYIYAGVELMPILGYSEGDFPLTVGVNFRVDASGRNAFNKSTDIAPYFSLNMGFINSFRNKKSSYQPQRVKE